MSPFGPWPIGGGLGNLRPPFLDPLLDLLLHALLGRLVVTFLGAQIILDDEMLRVVVRVLVALAVAEPLGAVVAGIAQVFGHGQGASGLNVLQRRIDGYDGAV